MATTRIIKHHISNGTEMERALMIDEIINQSWANLAEQMAQTPQGMMASMANAFNDIRSNIGAQLIPAILMVVTTIQGHLPQIEQMINGFIPIIQNIIQLAGQVIDVSFGVYNVIAGNWGIIEPILWGIVAAFTAWKIITLIQAAATWLLTAANWALVTAVLANPLTWLVVGIAAVIAAIVAWVKHVGGLRIAWLYAVNAILTAWDWLKIGFFTGVHYVLDLWDKMQLGMRSAGVAIANFMGDMKADVLTILQNMVNGAVDIINGFINVLNNINGVHIDVVKQVTFGTMAQLESTSARQARNADLEAYRNQVEAAIAGREAMREQMIADAQAATAERLAEIHALRAAVGAEEEYSLSASDYVYMDFDGIANDISDIAANTGAMAKIGEEDLRFWRDIAERDAINRFTTAEIKVDMSNMTNRLDNSMDLDGVISRFVDGVTEALDFAAEGVHA